MSLGELNKDTIGVFSPTPHPIIYTPTADDVRRYIGEMGMDGAIDLLQLREDKIRAEKLDPYRHGYEGFHFKDATDLLRDHEELLVSGGNRAGKTEWAAKRVACVLSGKPDARVWCVHTTHQSSVQMQQPVVYKYLPPEYKLAKKSKVTNVSFSQKNGFSDNTFVLPNGSQCVFYNTAQEIRVVEGGEVDMVWVDELCPLSWIETLRYRLVTRRGKLILTFTPITGYTPVVKEYIAGSRITDWRPAPMLGDGVHIPGGRPGMMPYRAKCWRPGAAAIWFHSEFNKHNPFDQLEKTLEGRSKHEKKIRAFGWADSLSGAQFPKFGEHNIVEPDKVPTKGTNYMAIDPAGARNWFMLWLRVDDLGRKFVYREWPDVSVGEWALTSEKLDGKAGLGQRNGAGRGIDGYKALIRELEGKEEIAIRYIDPRAGGTQAVGREGGTSLIELLEEGDGLWVEPAAGLRIDEGVGIVNDWLAWSEAEPLSPLNEPGLFVSSACQNLIYSMREWTGHDGDKGACKDPVDVLRYLAVMNPDFVDTKKQALVGVGRGY